MMETAQKSCARCGMEQATWTANHGKGFAEEGEYFCCKGCAKDTGCTCDEDAAEEDSL